MSKGILPRLNFVLPTVYDDSLSYYEAICKLAKQLEDFINGDFTDVLIDAVNNLVLDARYDEENERLIISTDDVVVADGEHIYSPSTGVLTIK